MELREKIAEATYHFVHRGKTHLDWNELPYKWGKKSYYEFTDQILALIEQEYEPVKIEALTDEEIAQAIHGFSVRGFIKDLVTDRDKKISQATIAKNQEGQLYRRKLGR